MSAAAENRTKFLKKVFGAEGGLVAAVYDRRGGRNGKRRRSQSAATNRKLFLDDDGGRGITDGPRNRPAVTFSPMGGEGRDEGATANDTNDAKGGDARLSRRDCLIQPKVGAPRLPWVGEQNDFNPERVGCGDGGEDATLSGLGLMRMVSQGSSCRATLV
jgi:hypothetical protein